MAVVGALALGLAVLGLLLCVSFFLSPIGIVLGVVALLLALSARGHERSHTTGTAAVVIAVVALCSAAAVLTLGAGA